MDYEGTTIQTRKQYWEENIKPKLKEEHQIEKVQNSGDSEDDRVPEIKDIYDHIYGNVRSKRVFYENQKSVTSQDQKSPKAVTPTPTDIKDEKLPKNSLVTTNVEIPEDKAANFDLAEIEKCSLEEECSMPNSPICSLSEDVSILLANKNMQLDQKSESETETLSVTSLPTMEVKSPNPDLLKSCEFICNKCQKVDFINDRSEVLTEINTNLKLELESVKKNLKEEMVKNSELNFEIANIESVLETYYKEAKNQKSTLASIYSTMKNYVSENKYEFQESYTYKRIKMIANYIESLKNKLDHQDKIIKNNFIENPYYTDLIIKHEAILKQLDNLSRENQELKESIKLKASEELEIIKELNRQKFQLENKFKEMENRYKNEVAAKDINIKQIQDEHRKELENFQAVLDKKDEEIKKIERTANARINNYKHELVIVYRKWKEQKKTQNST